MVTARGADGTELRLLCKYARTNSHPAFGHRRGIEYEIRMYADLLSELQLPTPRYYGSHHEPSTGEYWLVMEYFDGGLTVNKGPQPAAIVSAAQVMGDLHARGETLLRQADFGDLIEYDTDYFRSWASRLLEYAEPLSDQYPWLGALCDGYMALAPHLAAFPTTLIHGEYTVHNVLLREGTIPRERWTEIAAQRGGVGVAPIDWESAARSFGEIDLAFMLDGAWPSDIQQICVEEYILHRFGSPAPPEFERRFLAAQLYMHVRWMGDRPEKTLLRKSSWRFQRMEGLGRTLGLL
ncbi:MAG: aminoglycoside phosphotransferase family protein [Gemmatimonadaceae bacterium]|nr:aminoglycoside phosphotransferase family protein [Gemmatimonadaceae bacterium]